MGKKRANTAFPFLILLVGVIGLVVISDRVANNLNETPRLVTLSATGAVSSNDLVWQFELEELVDDQDFKADSAYQKAVAAYKSRKWNTAELDFVSLTSKYPARPELLNYLGLIEMNQGRLLEAMQFFQQSLSVDSAYQAAMINLGLANARLENFEAAERLYNRAIAIAPQNPKPFLNKGIMHCKAGEWRKAKFALKSAAEKSSSNQKAKALTYLGMATLSTTDTAEARTYLNEAINLSPAFTLPRVHLAMSYSQPETQLEEMQKVIALNEKHAPAHFYLGTIYEALESPEEAEKHFERALSLNPGDVDVQLLLGNYYIENERLDEASRYFNQVYRGDTISPQHYFYEAKIASRKNDIAEAINLYNKAIDKSDGQYAEAHLNKAILLKRSGQVEAAIDAYENAIEAREEYEQAWYNLALAHKANGSKELAVQCYEKAIELNPRAEKAMYNLGIVLKSLGREEEAVNWWKRTLQVNPDYVKALYNIGLNAYKKKDYDQAKSIFERVIQQSPAYTKAWFNLGLTEKQLGNVEGGISAYERAIDLDPTYIAAWKNLGSLHAQNDQLDLAIQEFQQAIDLDRTDPALRYNLALQYEKSGALNEALIHLNKAVQLNPDYVRAIEKWMSLSEEAGNKIQSMAARAASLRLNEDAEAAYDLGRDYHKADRFNEAIQWYRVAEDWGKEGPWVVYWRGKAEEENGVPSDAIQTYEQNLKTHPDHKFTLYRLYLLSETTKPSRAAQLLSTLKNKYPEFCEEKNL